MIVVCAGTQFLIKVSLGRSLITRRLLSKDISTPSTKECRKRNVQAGRLGKAFTLTHTASLRLIAAPRGETQQLHFENVTQSSGGSPSKKKKKQHAHIYGSSVFIPWPAAG